MKVQSLSIVVPNKECINKCPFCVSRMVNSDIYPNKIAITDPQYDFNVQEYMKRMKHVAGLGCQTVMLTGTSEPQQNKQFLIQWAMMHKLLGSPFTNIEMQTTGLLLNNRDYLRLLRNFVGVSTIALSINALDDSLNNEILGHGLLPEQHVKLHDLCQMIKEFGFNIRCCFNLNDAFDELSFEEIIGHAKSQLYSDQVTFRKLYASNDDTPQGKWIAEHKMQTAYKIAKVQSYPTIGQTAYGMPIHDINGMSVIYDDDCMGKKPTTEVLKYLILRPNCKLYSSWDTPASLVF